MTQTDILFFHNFRIFHLWDHFFWKKFGERGGVVWDCAPWLNRFINRSSRVIDNYDVWKIWIREGGLPWNVMMNYQSRGILARCILGYRRGLCSPPPKKNLGGVKWFLKILFLVQYQYIWYQTKLWRSKVSGNFYFLQFGLLNNFLSPSKFQGLEIFSLFSS